MIQIKQAQRSAGIADTKFNMPLTLGKPRQCKTLTIYIPTPCFFSS
jgi:hypothetical protein